MKLFMTFGRLSALVFTGTAIAIASTAAALPALADPALADPAPAANVTVNYADPQHFTEKKLYGSEDRFNSVDYLTRLRAYIVKQATPLLAPDQQLRVTITDVRLAGGFEPWRGPEWQTVRFMTDVYPPRIDLRFKLTNGQGQVLKQGTRKLSDLSYLSSGISAPGDRGPLHYDKAMLRRWLTREFRKQ